MQPTAKTSQSQARRVDPVYRVAGRVAVEVGVAACDAERIGCRPAADRGVVVPGAEVEQAGVRVGQAAGETEREQARIGVARRAPEGVGLDLLDDRSVRRIDQESGRPEVVGDDEERLPVPDDVHGRGRAGAVDEAFRDLAGGIQLGRRTEGIDVGEATDDRPTDLRADAPPGGVEDVLGLRSGR